MSTTEELQDTAGEVIESLQWLIATKPMSKEGRLLLLRIARYVNEKMDEELRKR